MTATDTPRLGVTSLLSLAASSAALVSPTAGAAPGDPIGPPIIVANDVGAIDVARAGNGRIVASYLKSGALMAKRYAADGTPQGAPITVTASPGFQVSGGVSMDADGDFVVAWATLEDRREQIRAQRYAADGTAQGGTIEVASVLATTTMLGSLVRTEQGLSGLTVDMNADGDFAVLFSDYQQSLVGNQLACKYLLGAVCTTNVSESLRLRRYDQFGAPKGLTSLVTAVSERNVEVGGLADLTAGRIITGTDVEMRADGSTVVAWSTQGLAARVERGHLYTRAVGANGLARLTREIGTASSVFRADVRLDSAADGSVALVHRSIDYSQTAGALDCGVELDLLAGDGTPLKPRTRVDLPGNAFDCLPAPDVSIDAAGNHVVAFREAGGLLAQRYAAGGTALAGLFNVTEPDVIRQGPVIASDAVGNFVIGYTLAGGDFVLRLHEGP